MVASPSCCVSFVHLALMTDYERAVVQYLHAWYEFTAQVATQSPTSAHIDALQLAAQAYLVYLEEMEEYHKCSFSYT